MFARIVDRVQELLSKRREERRAQLERMLESAFDSLFSTADGKALKNGSEIEFSALPEGLQSFFMERASQNPSVFGLTNFSVVNIQRARVSVPEGGLRVFVSFMLDGTLPASDGSPVSYSIAFEIDEIIG